MRCYWLCALSLEAFSTLTIFRNSRYLLLKKAQKSVNLQKNKNISVLTEIRVWLTNMREYSLFLFNSLDSTCKSKHCCTKQRLNNSTWVRWRDIVVKGGNMFPVVYLSTPSIYNCYSTRESMEQIESLNVKNSLYIYNSRMGSIIPDNILCIDNLFDNLLDPPN